MSLTVSSMGFLKEELTHHLLLTPTLFHFGSRVQWARVSLISLDLSTGFAWLDHWPLKTPPLTQAFLGFLPLLSPFLCLSSESLHLCIHTFEVIVAWVLPAALFSVYILPQGLRDHQMYPTHLSSNL